MNQHVRKAQKRKAQINKIVEFLMSRYAKYVEAQSRTLRIKRERCELRSKQYYEMSLQSSEEAQLAESAIADLKELIV